MKRSKLVATKITEETYKKIEEIAVEKDWSISQVIRKILEEKLK